jgi:hypothetical protein
MKKVKYLLGATAFVAPVLGVAAPAAANAAPKPAAAPRAEGKTVSVQFLGATAGTAASAAGCTGDTAKKVTGSGEYMKFWHTSYSQSQCIGTVVGHYSYDDPTGSDPAPTSFRVTIRHNGKVVSPPTTVSFNDITSTASVGLHKIYRDPVEVCGAFLSSGKYAADYPPICTTIG